MNYKFIKIFFFFNIYTYTNKLNFFISNKYHYLDLIIFLKKNNSSLKKIFNISINSYQNKPLLYSNFFKINLTNFLKINLTNLNKNLNNLKLLDLKKKFIKNLIEYRNFFNFVFNLKKLRFKNFFKNFHFYYFFFKKISTNVILFNLKHVVMFLKYIYNYSDFFYLIKNNFLFLNRKVVLTDKYLKKNDIIEFLYFKNFFFYISKINSLIFKKNNLHKNFNYTNIQNLQKSQTIKLFNNFYFSFFNKNVYYENDFKTLSFILINKNFSISSFLNYKFFFFNIFLINLYK